MLRCGASDAFNLGPLASRFPLTLESGVRTEALGPLFYSQREEDQRTVACPPFFSRLTNSAVDAVEFDLLYPLLTYDRFGPEYRWQFFQLLGFSGSENQSEQQRKSFMLFPIYFQQRSEVPEENYTALFPIHGKIQGHLFRSEIEFTLWPLYIKSIRRRGVQPASERPLLDIGDSRLRPLSGDVTTYNYCYPFVHRRFGDGLRGWQFWPFYGAEQKVVTYTTNGWGEAVMSPGHDRRFVMWPFYINVTNGIGSDNPEHQRVIFPFYASLRSPKRDSTSYGTPLGVTVTDDRARKYHETDAPWPFIVKADGEGKFARRVWPFYGHATNATASSDFVLWPVYKRNRLINGPLDRSRTRVLFFLASHTKQTHTENHTTQTRTDVWPLFTHRKEADGSRRLQVLAPLEPLLPTNDSVERNYSPLWSVWRAETNAVTGSSSRSLLWNLYRRECAQDTRRTSFLFGMFEGGRTPEGRAGRLFFIPFGGGRGTNSAVRTKD